LEREIHQVTPAKRKHFNKLFQHHERQLLQEVGTKATGPRSIIAKKLAVMKTAAGEEAYGAVNMTADKRVQFQVCLSDAEIEATTWSIADTDRVVIQLEREIYGITLKDQMRFREEFSIRLVEFEAWWQAISVQELRKTIEQRVIHFGYPKMHLMSHISESIRRMGSGDNFTTDISERLHIGNVKRHIDLPTKSITFNRCSNTMTGVPDLTIWSRHCQILPFKAGTILTLPKFSTNYQLPINGETRAEPIFYASTIVRKSHFSALYHNRYIIREKLMSAACAEASN